MWFILLDIIFSNIYFVQIAKPIITNIHDLYALNARERLIDLPAYQFEATQYGKQHS